MSNRYEALDAVVAALTTTTTGPLVASNYESGGHTAYATWLNRDTLTLTTADLGETVDDTMVSTFRLVALDSGTGAPVWDADSDPDQHPAYLTQWDPDADGHEYGTFTVYTVAADQWERFGVEDTAYTLAVDTFDRLAATVGPERAASETLAMMEDHDTAALVREYRQLVNSSAFDPREAFLSVLASAVKS